MDSILRAGFMYLFLMIVMRISGARNLAEITIFDFVLLLIIGDSSQQAITGSDYSIVNGVVVVTTLILLDIAFTYLKTKFPKLERAIDGKPLVIVIDGKPQKKIMKAVDVDEDDVMESARKLQGLENIEQIKYAILEKDGDITIIPKRV